MIRTGDGDADEAQHEGEVEDAADHLLLLHQALLRNKRREGGICDTSQAERATGRWMNH